MLLKDNEEKRNIAWRTVMTVTSVLIILIVIFFGVKLFTSNPLTGNWENTDDGMKLTIKNNGAMNIVQTLDESTISVPVDYTIDMEHKRFAIHVNEEKIAKQAEKIVAFTVGEELCKDTFVVHIEKAFADVQGAYPMINQQFVEHECMDYTYVNREDDAGEEGLRKAKLSYRPAFLEEKGFVTRIGGQQ